MWLHSRFSLYLHAEELLEQFLNERDGADVILMQLLDLSLQLLDVICNDEVSAVEFLQVCGDLLCVETHIWRGFHSFVVADARSGESRFDKASGTVLLEPVFMVDAEARA